MRGILFSFLAILSIEGGFTREYHVSVKGNDANIGSITMPYRTISCAARVAQPGDVITVHAGIYRESIAPPRGGESNGKRIVYQSAQGENAEIRGSEVIKNWEKVQDDIWKVTIPNSFFGTFNPYSDIIRGDWFDAKGREHHTGAVYLNGDWLTEAAKPEDLFDPAGMSPLWYAQVDESATTIRAQFRGVNPNEQLVEINVRQSVFYPQKPGMNYITVRGFFLRHAATPWAPPTAEQIGLIGTHWSKGWIIEDNVISHSACVGITLGKYGDEWDNKSANSAEGYVKTIERALQNGWNKKNIGHHIVRNNTISNCEQGGIVGSLGAIFSTITGNMIHDIHVRQLFGGCEMAGIKLHGAIDVEISRNHIYRTCRGLWLDWMAQGTRVSSNLFHDNGTEKDMTVEVISGGEQDMFVEVNHGPFLVDNNIFLSPYAINNRSQGGAYVHNLFAGTMRIVPQDDRLTPFHVAHSTELQGLHDNPSGDNRYYNNVFVELGDLSQYDKAQLPVWMNGNVFLNGARPSVHESGPIVKPEFDPALKLVEKSDGYYLELFLDTAWSRERSRKLVTSQLLGKAKISGCRYENPDGSPVRIDADFFGRPRNTSNPSAGPFEDYGAGKLAVKVDPTAVRIDPWTAGNVISPLLFSHNLEVTRRGVWSGLSAQMVANRKFAAVAGNQPKRWQIIDAGGSVQIDTTVAYAGKQSARMEVSGKGVPAGLRQQQEQLAVQKDKSYGIRIWVKTEKVRELRVLLNGSSPGPFFEKSFSCQPGDWQLISAGFKSSETQTNCTFEITSLDAGTFWIGAVSILPDDAFHGMRRDVIELLKTIKPGILRFPGGCYAEFYTWKDGLLPVDRRPPIYRSGLDFLFRDTDDTDTHEIGIDEYIALCREVGCQSAITARLSENAPEDAAAWVEYCNGDASTQWGKVRCDRGYIEPFHVGWWFVGNELAYFGRGKASGAAGCAAQSRLFGEAMKQADPDIHLVPSTYFVNGKASAEWNSPLLESMGPLTHSVSTHQYILDQLPLKTEADFSALIKAPAQNSLVMLRMARDFTDRKLPAGQHAGITFDEWNTIWGNQGTVPMGLYVASMLNMLCREAGPLGLEMACFFMPVNEGAIKVFPFSAKLDAAGQVFELYKVHQGNRLLQLQNKDEVDLCASQTPDASQINITMVNGITGKQTIEFYFAGASGFEPSKAIVRHLIPKTINIAETVFNDEEKKVQRNRGGNYAVHLEPGGIALLTIYR